ncbi:hypothetical protein MVEN_01468500 [Mycena venus]|uniref:Uncharacterized protein n=1 Tax=Mycena venus TaxID=2733690 RepID=A0A8H7CT62_9AGAR|nr:hypothetical protein MVEN_01468500 [Mycena venus]
MHALAKGIGEFICRKTSSTTKPSQTDPSVDPDRPATDSSQLVPKTLTQSYGEGLSNKFLKATLKHFYGDTCASPLLGVRRPEFWGPQPWQKLVVVETPPQTFPENDLLTMGGQCGGSDGIARR